MRIQRHSRGRAAKQHYHRQIAAARTMQRCHRGHQARKECGDEIRLLKM